MQTHAQVVSIVLCNTHRYLTLSHEKQITVVLQAKAQMACTHINTGMMLTPPLRKKGDKNANFSFSQCFYSLQMHNKCMHIINICIILIPAQVAPPPSPPAHPTRLFCHSSLHYSHCCILTFCWWYCNYGCHRGQQCNDFVESWANIILEMWLEIKLNISIKFYLEI